MALSNEVIELTDKISKLDIKDLRSLYRYLNAELNSKAALIDKSRVWAMILYPDSLPVDWLKKLNDKHIRMALSPLHTPEPDEDGYQAKEHYHLLIHYDGPTTQSAVYKDFMDLKGTIPQVVLSLSSYTRYLTHLDDHDKQQFIENNKAVLPTLFGGFNYFKIIQDDKQQLIDSVLIAQIFDYIEKEDILYIDQLIKYSANYNHDWYELIIFRNAYIVKMFITERKKRLYHIGENS